MVSWIFVTEEYFRVSPSVEISACLSPFQKCQIHLELIWEASDQTFLKYKMVMKSISDKGTSDLKKVMNRYQRRVYKIASSTAMTYLPFFLQKGTALAFNHKIISLNRESVTDLEVKFRPQTQPGVKPSVVSHVASCKTTYLKFSQFPCYSRGVS